MIYAGYVKIIVDSLPLKHTLGVMMQCCGWLWATHHNKVNGICPSLTKNIPSPSLSRNLPCVWKYWLAVAHA